MEMKKKMQDAINEQIKNELYSAYMYLAMAAWCDAANLPGFAHWLKVQAKEETGHAMKFYGFLNDRGARVLLKAVDQPPAEFKSPADIFDQTLKHEKKVTAMIENLCAVAADTGDPASTIFLQWFVTEQVEEEKNASDILATLKMIGESKNGMIMLDRQLAKRE